MAEHCLHHVGQDVVAVHRRLDDLDDAALVLDGKTRGVFGGLAELDDLALTPVGVEIPRTQHRKQDRRLFKLGDNLFVEDVAAGEFGISPDFGFLSHAQTEQRLQRLMEAADPALLLGGKGEVVDMGVADKQVALKTHIGYLVECSYGRTEPWKLIPIPASLR